MTMLKVQILEAKFFFLHSYVKYYHNSRTHLGLNKNCPNHRIPQPHNKELIIKIPEVGGLHHRYERVQA